jgi:hypothetical protein
VYGHLVALNSGGVDEDWNVAKMTHECNRYLYRKHEKEFEMFCKQNPEEDIKRVIKIQYDYTPTEILHMRRKGKNPDLYKAKSFQHNFYTGPPNNPTNQYLSTSIPNWNGQQAERFHMQNSDMRKMKKTDARRKAANNPHVGGPKFEK